MRAGEGNKTESSELSFLGGTLEEDLFRGGERQAFGEHRLCLSMELWGAGSSFILQPSRIFTHWVIH